MSYDIHDGGSVRSDFSDVPPTVRPGGFHPWATIHGFLGCLGLNILCMYTNVCVCMYMYMYMYMCICIYIYTQISHIILYRSMVGL